MMVNRVNELVNDLYDSFDACRLVLANNEGGQMRGIKGNAVVDFIKGILELIIAENNLPYRIEKEHKITIFNDIEPIIISCDLCILDENDVPLIWFECKDYTDACGYKRFLMEAQILLNGYEHIECVSVSMQHASTNETQSALINHLGLNIRQLHSYTLLPTKRNAKKNLYILDFAKSDIVKYTTMLMNNISDII